jgi:NAD(P)-dependent dehydrogenase (short-subunit alcohol dehydrogenase family)
VVEAIVAAGGSAVALPADLVEPAAPAEVVGATLRAFGRLDVLINNAGVTSVTPLPDVTTEQFDREFAVNVRAPLFLAQAALDALRRSPSGCIVNVSSASAWLYRPGQSVYGTTKAAVEYLTRSLAAELAADGVRVNAVVPGPTTTDIHLQWGDDIEATRAYLAQMTPLGRMGTAAEVATWIVRLTEDDAAWVTGSIFHVDGGRTLGAPPARPDAGSQTS